MVEAVGRNPDTEDGDEENRGGMVIYLESRDERVEVSRVAFVRRASRNPDTPFEDQLGAEIDKAETACKILNASAGELV